METRLLTPESKTTITVCPGWTAQEVVNHCLPVEMRHTALVFSNGTQITDLENYRVVEGESLLVACVPQGGGGGGKSILSAVLMIAVVAFAVWAAPVILGAGASAWATAAVVGAISMVGSLAINALIKPPSLNLGNNSSQAAGNTYMITGQSNTVRRYGATNKVYGRHKVFPTLAATPEINNLGYTSRFNAVYDFGIGGYSIDLSTLKIGDADAATFISTTDDLHWHHNSLVTDTRFVTRRVGYDQYSFRPVLNTPLILRTKDDAIGMELSIQFPRGLVRFNDQGDKLETSVNLRIQYREYGTTVWHDVTKLEGAPRFDQTKIWRWNAWVTTPYETRLGGGFGNETVIWNGVQYDRGADEYYFYKDGNLLGSVHLHDINSFPANQLNVNGITYQAGAETPIGSGRHEIQSVDGYWDVNRETSIHGASEQPFTLMASVDFPKPIGGWGVQWEVQVIRSTPDSTDNRLVNDTIVTMLKSIQAGQVFNLQVPHTMVEMRILATDKINSAVQNLNAIITSTLRQTADVVNFTLAPSRNPAWICLDILQGPANPRPLPDAMIDWTSWIALATYCENKKLYMDFVVDYVTTVQELVGSVLSAARASLTLTTAGKYGVLIDEAKSVPRQLITPENSWGFSGGRSFSDKPHALRVTFINPNTNWQKDEAVVYNDGYSATNATKFETLNTFGITSYDMAWRYARYMFKQGVHRSETFTVTMDIENLVLQRGDLCWVQHDVPQIGGMPARVLAVAGNTITVNTSLSAAPTGYAVRLPTGGVRSGAVTTAIDGSTFTLDNVAGIAPDDLIVLGVMNRVTNPYLVSSIMPGADLTAEISMVKYVDIYDDSEKVPPWDPGFGDDLINKTDLKVTSATSTQTLIYVGRMPFARIDLGWKISGFDYGKANVYISTPGVTEKFIGHQNELSEQFLIDLLNDNQYINKPVTFRIEPVNSNGVVGTSGSTTITPLPDTDKPLVPEYFAANVISNSVIELFWQFSKSLDVAFYELRYHPDPLTTRWDLASPLSKISWETNHTSVGARTGTYFLRVFDTSGNSSDWLDRRTTVEQLPELNVVEEIDESTTGWVGSKYGLVVHSGAPSGLYMKDWQNLASVPFLAYNSKTGGELVSAGDWGSVVHEGVYYFNNFADVGDIYECRLQSKIVAYALTNPPSDVPGSLWDVWVEYRTTNQIAVMADWTTLASVNPIAGSGVGWSPWRVMQSVDVTGRLFQFRIQTRSYDPKVKVVIESGKIVIDMPDLTQAKNDIVIPAGITTINYPYGFKSLKALAVTIDGNDSPVVAKIQNKNSVGFDISLINTSTNTLVPGQIDYIARGYGRRALSPI